MSGDGIEDVTIPAVFMKKADATSLRRLLEIEESVYVLLTWIPLEGEGKSVGEGDEDEEEGESEGENEGSEGANENESNQPGPSSDSQSVESGLFDSGMEALEPDHEQKENEHSQTCLTEACNSPDGSP